MPGNGEEPPAFLVDTSVAVALLLTDHEAHEPTFAQLADHRLGLCGHAAFETFSVLTRLPPPSRRPSGVIARLLSANFPASRFLSADGAASLLGDLGARGIAGGAIHDALVAATAAEHDLPLATRDHRALDTYRALGVRVEIVA